MLVVSCTSVDESTLEATKAIKQTTTVLPPNGRVTLQDFEEVKMYADSFQEAKKLPLRKKMLQLEWLLYSIDQSISLDEAEYQPITPVSIVKKAGFEETFTSWKEFDLWLRKKSAEDNPNNMYLVEEDEFGNPSPFMFEGISYEKNIAIPQNIFDAFGVKDRDIIVDKLVFSKSGCMFTSWQEIKQNGFLRGGTFGGTAIMENNTSPFIIVRNRYAQYGEGGHNIEYNELGHVFFNKFLKKKIKERMPIQNLTLLTLKSGEQIKLDIRDKKDLLMLDESFSSITELFSYENKHMLDVFFKRTLEEAERVPQYRYTKVAFHHILLIAHDVRGVKIKEKGENFHVDMEVFSHQDIINAARIYLKAFDQFKS